MWLLLGKCFIIGFGLMLGIEIALGLCLAIGSAGKKEKKNERD